MGSLHNTEQYQQVHEKEPRGLQNFKPQNWGFQSSLFIDMETDGVWSNYSFKGLLYFPLYTLFTHLVFTLLIGAGKSVF